MNKLKINPIKYIKGNIFIPGSKSISNRALLLSSLCFNQNTILNNILNCDDVNNMINILKILGLKIKKTSDISNSYKIIGFNNIYSIKNKNLELNSGNSGITFRSILSLMSLLNCENVILTGDNRMKERPIEDLVNSLIQGNSKIKFLEKKNYPPLKISGVYNGGNILINGSISSQFLSSLLMISPLIENDTNIYIKNNLVSKPYIYITINLMKIFGINVINYNYKNFYIKGNQNYISPKTYKIESDATSCSYFIAASVISKNSHIRTLGVGKNSIQGDIKFANILKNLGANIKINNFFIESKNNNKIIKSIDIDANDIPDSAMTLCIISLYSLKNNKSIIRNIYNWKVKETDRLNAMYNELKKIGAYVEIGKDFISILPPKKIKSAIIETYNDHRIAMCFSLIAFLGVDVTILNPNCVNKTFPEYFKLLYKFSKFYK